MITLKISKYCVPRFRFPCPQISDNGRIESKTETVAGITSQYVYTYDAMGRLLTVTKDGVPVEEYQYDPAGTRSYEMNTLRGIAGRSLTYSEEDHLLTAGDAVYLHDKDGFLTTKTEGSDVTAYDYSLRGELLSVTLPDGTFIEYVHDPLGRRIAKKVNGVITEKYLWQGMTRLLAVYDGSNALLMRFEYADARMPAAMTAGGATYYLGYDQTGTLKAVADASGTVIKRIEYDSFGNVIYDSDAGFTVPFGFAGGLYDPDTGLVRFGYRDYDPDTGRWTAKDPILFAGGDTDLYGYCVGDPVNWVDTMGLEHEKSVITLTLGIYHVFEGTCYIVGGVVLEGGMLYIFGPMGLVASPAAYAFIALGKIEVEIGTQHIEEYFGDDHPCSLTDK